MSLLQITDLVAAFGARVDGLVPGTDLDDASRASLRNAFDDRGLLLFRGIDIDRPYQTCIADLLIDYDRPVDDQLSKRDMLVSNKEPGGYAPFGRLLFHSDMMWHEEPFQVLSLYGVRIVAPAAPTSFVSTVRAWETLPDGLRAQVEGREAVHVTGQQDRGGDDGDLTAPIREKEESVTLPIAYPNPRTGRTMLYVSQMMTREIVGLPHDESEALLEELFAHLYAPENTYVHEWREGDLVAWDNQSVQHARSKVEQEGTERTLRKVISPIPVIAGKVETPTFSAAG